MRCITGSAALLALTLLACLPREAAASRVDIRVVGVASANSSGSEFLYLWNTTPPDSSIPPTSASFAGDPVYIALSVDTTTPGNYYVTDFGISWGNASGYSPDIIGGFGGTGVQDTFLTEINPNYFSSVSLSSTGGNIYLNSNDAFTAEFDSGEGFNFTYSLSKPHNPSSSFSDSGATGSGGAVADVTDFIGPYGPYDADSEVTFDVTSVSQTFIPEPSTWAMLICGAGMVGASLRRRREGMAVPA